jgi:hypothetical protein
MISCLELHHFPLNSPPIINTEWSFDDYAFQIKSALDTITVGNLGQLTIEKLKTTLFQGSTYFARKLANVAQNNGPQNNENMQPSPRLQ